MGVLSKVTELFDESDTAETLSYECGDCGTRFKQDYIECPQCQSYEVERAS